MSIRSFWQQLLNGVAPSSGRRRRRASIRLRPALEALECRAVPARVLVTAADAGGAPQVIVRADTNGDGTPDGVIESFMAYDPAFRGGVRVAMGDFDGDGFDELVTAAGPGGGPHIKIWSRSGLLDSFMAFDPAFRGGCWVATGDFNHDGKDELVVAADAGGGPHVKIYSDTNGDHRLSDNLVDSFFAFDPGFTGGVRIAAGVEINGRDSLVVAAGPGGGPHVKVYDNANLDLRVSDEKVLMEFFAFDVGFTGGVFVDAYRFANFRPAPANIIVSAGAGGGPHVKLFSLGLVDIFPNQPPEKPYLQLRDSFFAYDPNFTGGVRVTFSDLASSDGSIDVVTAPGPGGRSQVKIWSGDAGTGRVSDQPLDDNFSAFRAPDGTPLDIGVFVAFGTIPDAVFVGF
jgi:hypothetical protein